MDLNYIVGSGNCSMNGYQKIYDFDNGYSASVICNKMSYGGDKGLFEIAVIKNDQICENNPLGSSVVGFLDFLV